MTQDEIEVLKDDAFAFLITRFLERWSWNYLYP
jgi:hypothetical protein